MNILIGNNQNRNICILNYYTGTFVQYIPSPFFFKLNETIKWFEMTLQPIMCHYVLVCYGATQGRPDRMDQSIQQGDDTDNKIPMQDHVFIEENTKVWNWKGNRNYYNVIQMRLERYVIVNVWQREHTDWGSCQ